MKCNWLSAVTDSYSNFSFLALNPTSLPKLPRQTRFWKRGKHKKELKLHMHSRVLKQGHVNKGSKQGHVNIGRKQGQVNIGSKQGHVNKGM